MTAERRKPPERKTQEKKDPAQLALSFFDRGIDEMQARRRGSDDWLWHGLLAPRQITLLTAMWKTGKTTFIAGLLAKLKAGGDYCGLNVRPGRALVVSEEEEKLWLGRAQKLDLIPQVRFICKPFTGRPTVDEWQALLAHIEALHQLEPLDLVIIDTLTSFTPYRGENSPANALDFLLSLRRVTELGISVLLKHHPRKNESAVGTNARGTGALAASIDIILEMYRVGHAGDGERRRLVFGLSRHEETPSRMVVELNANHEYVLASESIGDLFSGGWPVLRVVLEDATHKLTRKEILKQWPDDFPRPDPISTWQWLDRAVNEGRVLCDGLGRKTHPFRYWLPGAEKRWDDRDIFLEDRPDIDPPPRDAKETAKKLVESQRLFFKPGDGRKLK
jgi:AAA domain